MNIYVSNLSFKVQDADLKALFIPFGEVTSAKIINDRETGVSRGFGFVEMSDDTAPKKAINELNGGSVESRTISVTEARPKEKSGFSGNAFKNKTPFKTNNIW